MDDMEICRRMMRRITDAAPASSALAKPLLGFARDHGRVLFGLNAAAARKLSWPALRKRLATQTTAPRALNGVLRLAYELAALLKLDAIDSDIIAVTFAIDRLRLPGELNGLLTRYGLNPPATIGSAAGAEPQDAERRVRLNPLFRFGLAQFRSNGSGELRLETRYMLEHLLDQQPLGAAEIIAALVGPRHDMHLPMSAFAHVSDADYLRRLLDGARREGARGINILIHGPPGTGKTEFARSLAAAAGLCLHGVGEVDSYGCEPDRYDRLAAIQMGQRLLADAGDNALIFDEMEDLIGDAQPMASDWIRSRAGSKIFVNRLLETNPVPIIWTTNTIANIDPAILRRMSYVLRLGLPSRATALSILSHIAREEGVATGSDWTRLVETAPEAASVLRVAARGGRLAGDDDGGVQPARSMVMALRGGQAMLPDPPGPVDPDLYETDRPLAPLFDALRDSGYSDVSLLLTGSPGTGKTVLAHHLARTLDRPLLVKRTSDLLSKWVGETEKQIADAFAEAREREAILFFDEADSLLFDRSTARASWEVSQVNELLTWLDRHPLPVVAATNHAGRLDPATLRRFVFKLELRALSPAKAARAFAHFFGMAAPVTLAGVGGLTPGDMAVVTRQLRYDPAPSATAIVERLRAEVAAKPGAPQPIGF